MEIKLSKLPNCYGYYGVSYFENGNYVHFVMKSFNESQLFVAEKSNYSAVLSVDCSKFQLWRY